MPPPRRSSRNRKSDPPPSKAAAAGAAAAEVANEEPKGRKRKSTEPVAKKKQTKKIDEVITIPKELQKQPPSQQQPQRSVPTQRHHISISELYHQLFGISSTNIPDDHDHDDEQEQQRQLQVRQWEERGILELVIWPWLVQAVQEKPDDYYTTTDWIHACQLLTLLVSEKCREGTVATALHFCPGGTPQHYHVLQQVVTTLLQHDAKQAMSQVIHEKDQVEAEELYKHHTVKRRDRWNFSAVVVHLVTILLASRGRTTDAGNPINDNSNRHSSEEEGEDVFLDWLEPHVFGIQLWKFMPSSRRLELELKRTSPAIRRKFEDVKSTPTEALWMVTIIHRVLHLLEGPPKVEAEDDDNDNVDDEDDDNKDGDEHRHHRHSDEMNDASFYFICRALELLVDILSLANSRLYLVPYLEATHFVVRLDMALAHRRKKDHHHHHHDNDNKHHGSWLLQDWATRLERLLAFPVHPTLPQRSLSRLDVMAIYHGRASMLQKLCHRYCPDQLASIVHAGVGLLCHGSYVINALKSAGSEETFDAILRDLLHRLRLVDKTAAAPPSRNFLIQILLHHLTIPPDPLEQLTHLPLYPTERMLWNEHLIPSNMNDSSSKNTTATVLSLPKLQTHFLSYPDYLWRNFELVRLSSAYDIREDLMDVIPRMRPMAQVIHSLDVHGDDGNANQTPKTEFRGWARMALEIEELRIQQVAPPKLGQVIPSQVVAEFTMDLVHCGASIRQEWDSLSEYDNVFLVAMDANRLGAAGSADDHRHDDSDSFLQLQRQFGVTLVRGCMISQIRDEEGTILNDPSSGCGGGADGEKDAKPKGNKRVVRVLMDPAQYAIDARSKGGTQMYQTLNLVVRRHGRENNFKAVLETIRGLMKGAGSIHRVIPPWLQTLLLGYDDPSAAHYKSQNMIEYATKTPGVTKPDAPLDFGDTFLSEEHLRSSFASENCKIIVDGREEGGTEMQTDDSVRKNYKIRTIEKKNDDGTTSVIVEATSYPFPQGLSGNPIRFTPVQVEAIRSGLSPGLTLVVGPPGTGKTDLVVQILANIYHSFPMQRTVIITHSNAALNDIFQKVMARGDVDERHMIRLGAGERELQTQSSHDFTKGGRVAHSLARRAQLLERIQQLSESLGLSGRAERGPDGSPSYTCETADYFQRHHVQHRVAKFEQQVKELANNSENDSNVAPFFPFRTYFNIEEDHTMTVSEAREKLTALNRLFDELAEYRPMEVLRSHKQRTDYLLMKQARIVAMTCTHAAIARSQLIELGFHYDNIVMEEAAQMMEVEAFVPLLLQRGDADDDSSSEESTTALSRLKRVCLIGDHHQLPPVVKNRALASYSNLDQSLFTRLIRLGVPFVQLNQQGRARAELARLYSWRYQGLGNLDHVLQPDTKFHWANAGLAHTFQLINVEDFEGRGESTPTPYFYQNVGEAEYAVALFQFLVLIGYPPSTISILTSYNGQKELLSDILSKRCGHGTPMAGIRPHAISTVDQYQGQQNDYVILSLVRTKGVGHIRDLRRLIVAVSRSRLGLYVLCRRELFATCHDIQPVWKPLSDAEPSAKLQLVVEEHYPTTTRAVNDAVPADKRLEIDTVTHFGSIVYSMQQEWKPSSAVEVDE